MAYKKAVIVADVGGTNTLIAGIYNEKIVLRKHFNSNNFNEHLESFVNSLKNKNYVCDEVCVCAAGPLEKNHIQLVNNELDIKEKDIKRITKAKKVKMLNDVEALGYFCRDKFKDKKLLTIAVGTGFGFCSVFEGNVFPSETGSSNIIYSEEYKSFIGFLESKLKRRLIIEDVVSGRGLKSIYEFYSKKILSANEISDLAKINDSKAIKSFNLFSEFLALKCQNLCYSFLPDTIVLGGGIIIKNKKLIMNKFKKEFNDVYRSEELINEVKIKTLVSKSASLFGCYYAIKYK